MTKVVVNGNGEWYPVVEILDDEKAEPPYSFEIDIPDDVLDEIRKAHAAYEDAHGKLVDLLTIEERRYWDENPD